MHWHHRHGSCIMLEDDKTKAQRIDGFCDGLVFSAEPVSLDTYYTLAVTIGDYWCGSLSLGLTTHDPSTLSNIPKYISPHLISKPGFWATFISEAYLKIYKRITFYINGDGQLRFVINELEEETAIFNLPTTDQLWLAVDIYGCTTAVKIIQEDDVPLEVYAKGPEAVYNFNIANNTGAIPTYRTRLMLIGKHPDRKSLVKKYLTSEKFISNGSTLRTRLIKGIEVSGHYNMHSENTDCPNSNSHVPKAGPEHGALCSAIMQTMFYQNLAINIARGEFLQKKKKATFEEKDADTKKQVSKGAWKISARGDRNVIPKKGSHSFNSGMRHRQITQEAVVEFKEEIAHKYLNELPDDISISIQHLLKETETKQMLDLKDNEKMVPISENQFLENSNTNITYSLWDIDFQCLHYDLLQFIFSPRAIYLLVIDLDSDFESIQNNEIPESNQKEEDCQSNLDEIILWIKSIHAYATPSIVPVSEYTTSLSPTVIIVGTYKKVISDTNLSTQEKNIEEKFLQIQDRILDKPFYGHIATPFFALEVDDDDGMYDNENSEMITNLQTMVLDVIKKQPYYGEELSLKWLRFEEAILRLLERGICYVHLSQIQEIARTEGIESEEGQKAVLSFYHDTGLIMHFAGIIGARHGSLIDTVIVDPLWLFESCNEIFTVQHLYGEQNEKFEKYLNTLESTGILDEALIDLIWKDKIDRKEIILEIMSRLDLLCQKRITQGANCTNTSTQYYLPSRVKKEFEYESSMETVSSVMIYLDFLGFLTDGLFHRLVLRAIHWMQEFNGRNIRLYHQGAKFAVDDSVDFALHVQPGDNSLLKVIIFPKPISRQNANGEPNNSSPRQGFVSPHICAKIRNFLESTLADLREMWLKRLAYKTCVSCPCDNPCAAHQTASCQMPGCKHFLLLDDCLANSVVLCDYRHVNTSFIQKRFPKASVPGHSTPILPDSIVMRTVNNETIILDGIGMVLYQRPSIGDSGNTSYDPRVAACLRNIAKLLNSASEGRDWAALAESLGYRQAKIVEFGEDLNPSLALIADWLFSSGNSCLSIDMLISCLKRLGNHQAVTLLNEIQDETDEMPVFISYQWDAQDEIILIRNRLEKYGLRCWMDIGQMGGGDLLYNRIYRGISQAKVILVCITPKYVVSHNCTREASLADLLGKPIIPVMVMPTPWPPPGPLAILLSQLIYTDMCGIGGHGGTGLHADWEDRLQEILNQIHHYVVPIYRRVDPVSAKTGPLLDLVNQPESLQNFVSMEAEESQSADLSDVPNLDEDSATSMNPPPGDDVNSAESQNEVIDDVNTSPSSSAQPQVSKCTICRIL